MKFVFLLGLLLCLPPKALASVSVNVNGSSYTIPQNNEKGWGTNVTSWIQAISANSLQPIGGSFTLTNDVDFGASHGLKAPWLISETSNPASVGVLRLAKTDAVEWRNNANGADLPLGIDSSDRLTFNSVLVPTATNASVQDSTFTIYDNGDNTKKIAFEASGITTGNTRTLTAPDASTTIVGTDVTQTLSNKNVGLQNGSLGSPSLSFTADSDTGMWRSGSKTIDFSAGAYKGLEITKSTGNFANAAFGGGSASVSDVFPIIVSRDQDGNTAIAVQNVNATASAGPRFALISDTGASSGADMTLWPNAQTLDSYQNRLAFHTSGTATGFSFVAAGAAPNNFKFYYNGGNTTDEMFRIGNKAVSLLNGSTLSLSGSSSGTISIIQQAAAGTYNFNLPTTAGNAGQVLTSQAGGSNVMTWSSPFTNPMTTTGDIVYSSDNSGTPARLGIGSSTNYMAVSSGLPAWKAFTAHTTTVKTSNGSQGGWRFVVSGVTTMPSNGSTCVNNGHTYTVIGGDSGKTNLWVTNTQSPLSSGTLTSCSTGDSTITFSSNTGIFTYSTPSTAKALWIRVVGGGAGGGGTAGASNAGAAGGGGGGSYVEKFISSPGATYYYQVGAHGSKGSAGNNAGTVGAVSSLISSDGSVILYAPGGAAGAGSAAGLSTAQFPTGNSGVFTTVAGGDLNVGGSAGAAGIVLAAGQAVGGVGGGNPLGLGGVGGQGTQGGFVGQGYGGGGGGGSAASGGAAQAGGDGSDGVVIFDEFYNGN